MGEMARQDLLQLRAVDIGRAEADNLIGILVGGDLVIDRDRHRVVRGGQKKIRLTPKEFELHVFLVQHAGRVLTHRVILKAIWGPHAVNQPEHLRVLVGSLRKKIEPDPSRPQYILTEP
jgi:two-component system KDP operon response regulator KdpE